VLLLARHFLKGAAELTPEAAGLLEAHPWPGNVRELEFAIQQAVALCQGGKIQAEDLRLRAVAPGVAPAPSSAPLQRGAGPARIVESQRSRTAKITDQQVLDALRQTGGNRNAAARLLGMSRATLFRRLKRVRGDEEE